MQKVFFIIIIVLSASGCRKFTEPGSPNNQLTSSAVFSSDATAVSAMLGIYSYIETIGLVYNLSLVSGITGDELINYNTSIDRVDLSSNTIRPENTITTTLWNNLYTTIYRSNAVIEGVSSSQAVSPAIRQQLRGEAMFIRSWCHFYLLQFFGDIPLILTTSYQANAVVERVSPAEVYRQLEVDLKEAVDLLLPGYVNPANQVTTERTRPNRFAAAALLARVYLFQGKWPEAETTATAVINETGQYALVAGLAAVFFKNSSEAIWQLEPKFVGANSYAGAMFPFTQLPSNVSIAPDLQGSFFPEDQRAVEWFRKVTVSGVDYFYAYKYRVGQNVTAISEYTTVIRLAEVYLIRAEARGRQLNFVGAADDINDIRSRAGLASISLPDLEATISELEQQRRWELFAEAGDRWTDLRRTGRLHTVMTLAKGSNWNETDQLYPIPQVDRDRNSRLSQNPGY